MQVATRDYREGLDERLADRDYAASYLDACLQEGDLKGMLIALGDVARVHGGISSLADLTELNRPSLYKILSDQGNPTIESNTCPQLAPIEKAPTVPTIKKLAIHTSAD